jgi:AbrB family looped-hinge helix DNA binding protein
MPIIDSAEVLPKGQITIPKDFREQLNISTGDRLTLVCKEDRLILMNPAVFALKKFQEAMKGEAGKAGLRSDDDVVELIIQMRREDEANILLTGDKDFLESSITTPKIMTASQFLQAN